MTHPLLAQLSDLLGPQVAVAEGDPDAPLYPQEAPFVATAIAKRQAEFAAGRSAARTAMAMLDHAPEPILRAENRSPIWPQGLVGSITHTTGLCFAAVARVTTKAALGVDAEQEKPLPENIRRSILFHPTELAANPHEATMIFSAKEAVYKALSPWLDTVWGFDAMHIELNPEQRRFKAHLARSAGPWHVGSTLSGVVLSDGNHIITGCSAAC